MGINPTDGEGIESFFGSDWCDFRFRLDGCKHAGVWRTLYIIAIVFTAPLVLIGIYLIHRKIYVKLWRAGGGILQIVDGAVKPRANEAFLLTGTLSLAGRLLYWCVTVGGGFGSNIVQEFFHDWPFVILWHGGVLFTVGVIYATPKSHITVNKKKGREGARQEATQITRSKLPSPQLCNVLLGLFLIVPSVTLPLFALLDGAARDRGNYALAKKYNTIHYLLWGIYCLLLSGVAVYFGYKLWKILDSNVENVHRGGSGKTTESGGPGKSDTDVPPEFRRAIIMLIVSLAGTILMEVSYGAVLISYGIFREEILSLLPASVFVGFNWIFASPMMTYPIFLVLLYNTRKTHQEAVEKSSSANVNHTGSSGLTRSPTRSAQGATNSQHANNSQYGLLGDNVLGAAVGASPKLYPPNSKC